MKSAPFRLIPRLEIKEDFVVKGYQYEGVEKIGSPHALALKYYEDSADEIIFIDTVASLYGRNTLVNVIQKVAREIFIPLTVGGGIKKISDITTLLSSGADKVAINTHAINDNRFLYDACREFGSQCIVLSVQAKKNEKENDYYALTDNARENPGIKVTDWILKAQDLGIGEILLSSVDRDGTKLGYDIELFEKIANIANVPVIAHGGAGSINDINKICSSQFCDAISFSSIVHYKIATIIDIKKKLREKNIYIR